MLTPKNWYREETDLWAEFGRRAPFSKRFSSKHSVDVCGREYIIVRQKSCFTLGRGSIRECAMTWLEYKEGTN
jgi:ribosomal protein S14